MLATASELLRTKLSPPPVRADRIARPRLTGLFSAGRERPLMLVCAPAGYGKTTLLGEWLVSQAAAGLTFGWFSLDEDDNDPTRFLTYLVAAFSTVDDLDVDDVLAMLLSPQPPPSKVVLSALIRRLEAFDGHLALVLDDYHLITTQPIHEAVLFLLDHLPAYVQLVITSREDPPFPLARLRGRDQLVEIRADDLRFTPEEAARFLQQMLGIDLSANQLMELDARTEGWIAGLQLVALALKGRDDIAGFITAFTGSHRFILDYLTEEVLNHQPDEARTFLLQTAILDRLNGELCDAVTGRNDGQQMLEQIERSNLFLFPLDDERYWYRYHHLFGDVLQKQLQLIMSHSDIDQLHRRASLWFEKAGWLGEAIEYALAGHHDERAAHLVEAYGDRLRLSSDVFLVKRYLDRLQAEVLSVHPKLQLIHAFMLARSGPYSDAEQRLEQAEQALVNTHSAALDAERNALRGQAEAIRATIWLQQSVNGEQTVGAGLQAFDLLPESDVYWRSWTAMIVGIAYFALLGSVIEGERWLNVAYRLGETSQDAFIQMTALFHLANIAAVRGQLSQAERNCQTLLRFAQEPGWQGQPAAGYARLARGWLRYARNDLHAALEDAITAQSIIQDHMIHRIVISANVMLALVRYAQGDETEARQLMQQAAAIVRNDDMKLMYVSVSAWQAWFWLRQGDTVRAAQWAAEIEPTIGEPLDPILEFDHITLARILMSQDRASEALELLGRLFTAASAAQRMGRALDIVLLRAVAEKSLGRTDDALQTLTYALSLAAPEGYVRPFLDEGEPMAALLNEAKARGIAAAYVSKLLDAFNPGTKMDSRKSSERRIAADIEPLSNRELEVLHLIAEGASNREIAEALVVSIGTVKKHVNNIFLKLDARSRTQAIAAAQRYNILS